MTSNQANRVDRLRMLGNGVVPLCAARAFATLWERLSVTERRPLVQNPGLATHLRTLSRSRQSGGRKREEQ